MTATFAWQIRLKYALCAGLAAWFVGWLSGFPFEYAEAWRYADGQSRLLPGTLAEGLLVWAAFSLFIGLVGFLPLLLPLFLLISPRWLVRWRWVVIPATVLTAIAAINKRMGFFTSYYLRHPEAIRQFFFSAPNFFVVSFSLVVVWAYISLARRRLASAARKM